MFTKYHWNQLFLLLNCSSIVVAFTLLFDLPITFGFGQVTIFLVLILNIHYCLNGLHQASHQLLSKDRGYNRILGHLAAIFGGLSYSEFAQSHGLHHKFQGQKTKDPDYNVTHSSNLWLLPFQIWRKDVYFFQNGLHLKSKAWLGYLVDRGVQIGLVLYFFIWPGFAFYFAYWLLAVLVVGFLNGLFLFYFPHYSTKWEIKTRSLARIWLLPSISLAFIDICRYYHEWHHNQIKNNRYYFPLENYLYQKLIGQNQNLQWTGKYLHKI